MFKKSRTLTASVPAKLTRNDAHDEDETSTSTGSNSKKNRLLKAETVATDGSCGELHTTTSTVPFNDVAPWAPNSDDVDILKRTWISDKRVLRQFGAQMYQKLFETEPALKRSFPRIFMQDDRVSLENAKFRTLAHMLAEMIDFSLQHVCDTRRLNAYLHDIGTAHRTFVVQEIVPTHWQAFSTALVVTMHEYLDADDEAARAAWHHFFVYIVRKVYIGYTASTSQLRSVSHVEHSRPPSLNARFVNAMKRHSIVDNN